MAKLLALFELFAWRIATHRGTGKLRCGTLTRGFSALLLYACTLAPTRGISARPRLRVPPAPYGRQPARSAAHLVRSVAAAASATSRLTPAWHAWLRGHFGLRRCCGMCC